jgi:hypothetical protein
MSFVVDIKPTSATDSTPCGKFGITFFTTRPCKLDKCCKFDKAQKFTGMNARRGSISKMAIHGVSSGEILGHACHKSVRINTEYQTRKIETPDSQNSCFMTSTKVPHKNNSYYNPYPPQASMTFSRHCQYPYNVVQYNAPVCITHACIHTNNGNNSNATGTPTVDWYVFNTTNIIVIVSKQSK